MEYRRVQLWHLDFAAQPNMSDTIRSLPTPCNADTLSNSRFSRRFSLDRPTKTLPQGPIVRPQSRLRLLGYPEIAKPN
ncbi:hypothetical protein J6590_016498 [Homalodisca vitripennis]|nr:hypothetical protein J6590_016498 [Homalodisca vitripennis]